jgi:2-polyprenyl-6-methoxyphenol hydroxylase-like FAD-dependent oxidoreductase
LNIQEGKQLVRVEEISDGIRAHFQDGTSAEGTILIGADGNNSNVRKFLMPEDHELNKLPVHLVGVVRHFTPEQAAPIRALDPLLFQALHPKTQNYLWYSVQVRCRKEPSRCIAPAKQLLGVLYGPRWPAFF